MLQFVRRHPILGLFVALCLEAWIALPGETLISVSAASLVGRGWGWMKAAAGGLAGILVNDVILLGLGRAGRRLVGHVAAHSRWAQLAGLHVHAPRLGTLALAGIKFIPPLRSAGFLMYGLQGGGVPTFLAASLASSAVWVAIYTALGGNYRVGISKMMHFAEQRSRWVLATEIGLTVAGLVLALPPLH